MVSSDNLQEQVLAAFHAAFQALHQTRMDRLLSEKLTMPQLKVLGVVTRMGSAHEPGSAGSSPTVGDLAKHLHLSAPTVTGIVDRLHAAGLVERNRLTTDRRVVAVLATDKGRKLLSEVFAAREEHLRRILGAIGEEDARALLRGLEAFAKAVTAVYGGETKE